MTYTKLKFQDTIGIIGGGQLGKMMAQSAVKRGFKVIVLDPSGDAVAKSSSDDFVQAAFDDLESIKQFAARCDVITYEFENINAEVLNHLTEHYNLPQRDEAIKLLQDRYVEKQTLTKAGVHIAPYHFVDSKSSLDEAIETIGYPLMLKTQFGGYDGKGQIKMTSDETYEEALQLIDEAPCVAEQFIDLKTEVSVTATRGQDGQLIFFPLQENIHQDQVLFQTKVPSSFISYEDKAREEVQKIVNEVHFVGSFTVEFFISQDDQLYVNEIAPRPHNSGHHSIESCNYSQFDTHILAVAGYPLPAIKLLSPAIMINLLGQQVIDFGEDVLNLEGSHVHFYGKSDVRPKRKMGHVTFLSEHLNELEHRVQQYFKL